MVSSTHRSLRWNSDRIASNRRLYPSPDERNPCGARVYLQRPNGVMKVVRFLSDSLRGTLWYPFQASVTVFQVLPGIRLASWNGESDANVSLLQNLFRGDRSTVLLGVPSCFLVTTIRWHQVTGSP